MTEGLNVWRCTSCGVGFFPERLLCPTCFATTWTRDRIYRGKVEEVTRVWRAIGRPDWQPHNIASVRTSDGQMIIAAAPDDIAEGMDVVLGEAEGAPICLRALTPVERA